MVAGLLWQLRVWRMRVVAAPGRDYWQSVLVGPVLLLCELLLMVFARSESVANGNHALAKRPETEFLKQIIASKPGQ